MIVTEPGDDLWLNEDEVTGLGAAVLLSAVLGYAELLLIAPQDSLTDRKREDIRTIQQASGRMITLVNQLQDGFVRITAAAAARSRVEVAVSNSGIGITAEPMPYIFEGFHQAESGVTRRDEGTGLGLAIAWKLADQMGSTVSSELGVGPTLTLHLSGALAADPPVEWISPATTSCDTDHRLTGPRNGVGSGGYAGYGAGEGGALRRRRRGLPRSWHGWGARARALAGPGQRGRTKMTNRSHMSRTSLNEGEPRQ